MRYKKNSNFKRRNIVHSIPIGCMLALLLLGGVCFNPWQERTEVHANTEATATSQSTPSLSLSFDNNASSKSQNVTAGAPGFIGAGFKVTATGIDENGYSIYAQAADGYSNYLTGQANTNSTIAPITVTTVGTSIPANAWGYNVVEGSLTDAELATQNYRALPANGTASTPSFSSNVEATDKQFTLALGANIGTDKASDHYKTTVLLSVAAGAREITALPTSFAGYTTMQEINKTVCDSADIPIGTEGRLMDSRDNKWYWVAKLPDGLCWMTQNLDYKGGGAETPINQFYEGDSAAKYYDPGEKYPCSLPTTNCVNSLGDLIELESEVSWSVTDDSNFITSATYTGTDGTTLCNKTSGLPFGTPASKTTVCNIYYRDYKYYIQHYLVGNYYNFYAATNGTVLPTIATGEATGSVCPAGWGLARSGWNGGDTVSDSGIGSYAFLLNKGGIANDVTAGKLVAKPYYFSYSGDIYSQKVEAIGRAAYLWSSTMVNASSYKAALALTASDTGVSLGGSLYQRSRGMSVRCVAR